VIVSWSLAPAVGVELAAEIRYALSAPAVGLTVKVAPPAVAVVRVPSVTVITLLDSALCATKTAEPTPAVRETLAAAF
jgi:hypothetical protein